MPDYPKLPPEGNSQTFTVDKAHVTIERPLNAADQAAIGELRQKLAAAHSDLTAEKARSADLTLARDRLARALAPGRGVPNVRSYLGHALGFTPEQVVVTGPAPQRLDLPPEVGGFTVGEAIRTRRPGGKTKACVQLHAKADQGFTVPPQPAEVKPATFAERIGSDELRPSTMPTCEEERRTIRRSVMEFPFNPVLRQLGGPALAYATDGSSGLDLPFAEATTIRGGETLLVGTGIKLEIPPGYEGQIRPRSSCPDVLEVVFGTIDSDYRGEVKIKVRGLGPRANGRRLLPEAPIAQLVICPVARVNVEQVEEISETTRGEGGFGSTDAPTEGPSRTVNGLYQEIEAHKARKLLEEFNAERTHDLEGQTSVLPPEMRAAPKHPIQAAAERVQQTTEALLAAKAEAKIATDHYQKVCEAQERKSRALACACNVINATTFCVKRPVAEQVVETGNAALSAGGFHGMECFLKDDRLHVRELFASRSMLIEAGKSDEGRADA